MSATNAVTHEGYTARVAFDAADEVFIGRLTGVDDVVEFQSDTAAGSKAAFHEGVRDDVATREKVGKPAEKPYSGKTMPRVAPGVQARAAPTAQLSGRSMARWGEGVLSAAAKAATAE